MANTTAMYFKLHLRKRLKKTLLLKPHDNIFQLLTMRTTVLFVALLVAAFARSKGPNIMCGLCEVFAAVLEGKFERSDKDIGKVCVIDLSYLTCKEMNSHESATCIAQRETTLPQFSFYNISLKTAFRVSALWFRFLQRLHQTSEVFIWNPLSFDFYFNLSFDAILTHSLKISSNCWGKISSSQNINI